jgi:uroporphyrinogen-III decarboxylase
MNSKERIMTALHKGKPDRLPISVHQWQDYHLNYYLNGISALQAFQKFGMDAQIQYFGDVGQSALVDFKRKVGNRLAVIGGLDQFNVLTAGPAEKIRDTVHTLFQKVGADGGYVCSVSDHFFDAPIENLQVMADAAKERVYN